MTLAAKLKDERWIGQREGIERGTLDTKIGIVKRMLDRQKSLEEIADICGLDLDEVKKIAEDE